MAGWAGVGGATIPALGSSSDWDIPGDLRIGGGSPWVDVRSKGAVAGTSDSTAAFSAASATAGIGGTIFVPEGTFTIGDWLPSFEFQKVQGVGRGLSYLKAKAGATYAVDLTKLRDYTLADLTIHGNARASKGIRLRGGASGTGSERNGLERVGVTQCSTGIDVVTAAVDQVDKNTYYRCFINDCALGMSVNSINGQQQHLIDCHFEACDNSITLTNGSLEMHGGQIGQAGGTGILLNGTTIPWLLLEGVIFEGQAFGIDGNTAWPINDVVIINSVIDGSTRAVRMGATAPGSVLKGICSRFLSGGILLGGANNIFDDDYCSGPTNQSVPTVTITGTDAAWRRKGRLPYVGVASASPLTLVPGPDTFLITGTANIDRIEPAGWVGQTVRLVFSSTATVRHNFNNIFLVGAVNFVATANDSLVLVCHDSNWYEVSRSVV